MRGRYLQTTPFIEDRIDDSIEPEHLLLVYRWLKAYESEKDLDAHYHYVEKKIRQWCKELTLKIAGLRKVKVSKQSTISTMADVCVCVTDEDLFVCAH